MKFALADYVVKSIVSQPDAVEFSLGEHQGKRVLIVRVAPRDIAKVMGSRVW